MASAFSKQDKFFLAGLLVVFVLSLLVWAWDWDSASSGETPAPSLAERFRQPENAQVPNELLQKAQSGEAADLYAVGHFYKMKNDWQNAVIWYEKAAALGYSKAYSNLGVAYVEGYGVQRDVLKACRYFDLAYETMQDAVNAANVALCANDDDNPQRDVAKAFRFYKLAAEQGNMPQEQRNLGMMYLGGHGTETNAALGVYWLRQAVVNGDVRALYVLGFAYWRAEGMVQHEDNNRVAYLLFQAAKMKARGDEQNWLNRQNFKGALKQIERQGNVSDWFDNSGLARDLQQMSGQAIIGKIDEMVPYTAPNLPEKQPEKP